MRADGTTCRSRHIPVVTLGLDGTERSMGGSHTVVTVTRCCGLWQTCPLLEFPTSRIFASLSRVETPLCSLGLSLCIQLYYNTTIGSVRGYPLCCYGLVWPRYMVCYHIEAARNMSGQDGYILSL